MIAPGSRSESVRVMKMLSAEEEDVRQVMKARAAAQEKLLKLDQIRR